LLLKLADLMERDADELAKIESIDNGMPISFAKNVVIGSAGWIRYYAGFADKIKGTVASSPAIGNPEILSYTLIEPLGVVGLIVPWNFPLHLTSWKLAPALACANTVVLKPSEKTPLSTLKLAALIKEAGFPPGVVNVVTGYGHTAGDALARHMKVRKISFTGSVQTGKSVLKAAAESNLKKVTLELGGKSPVIVCKDADLDEAVFFACFGIFMHQGQFCAAGSRVFVDEEIYDQFVEKAINFAQDRLEAMGDPLEEDTMFGPVVDDMQYKKVLGYIESGIKEGAKISFGGQTVKDRSGYFIQPTVFSNVQDHMKIAKEEIFGPVQSILKFKDLKDAIARANNTEYGLAAAIFSRDIGLAHGLARELEAGTIWINNYGTILPQTAFGGYKQSGIGRENSELVLSEYTTVKTVTVQISKL